jgi:hypothetical protein
MKQQKQLVVLIVLVLIGAGLWYWNSQQNPASTGASSIVSNYSPMNVDNLTPRIWERDNSRKAEYKGSGRDPFSAVPPPPPVVAPPQKGQAGYIEPPPPPPPKAELPPNMKFYGYGTVPNGTARRAYLSDGDEVYIVAEGDTLLGHYRILKIGNATIEFEDTNLHVQGQKTLEDVGPTTTTGS